MRIRKQRTAESYVLQAVMDILAAERIFAIRLNTGVITKANGNRVFCHSGGPGVADVLAFPEIQVRVKILTEGVPILALQTHPLWIECKSERGHQSAEQQRFQADIEDRGHSYLIARSSDNVLAWLKEHGCR